MQPLEMVYRCQYPISSERFLCTRLGDNVCARGFGAASIHAKIDAGELLAKSFLHVRSVGMSVHMQLYPIHWQGTRLVSIQASVGHIGCLSVVFENKCEGQILIHNVLPAFAMAEITPNRCLDVKFSRFVCEMHPT